VGNRHSHKKLRTLARARMARTGESYQRARERVLASQNSASESSAAVQGFELLELSHLGRPAVLATWRTYGVPVAILLSEALGRPLVLPRFHIQSFPASWLEGDQ
jgi:hypothetical protein